MANTNNIKLKLANGLLLDYESPESLGIKLNRIVDDFQKPTTRFGEFSYTFNLPRTKNNDQIFEYPDVKGRIRIFVGKSFDCTIFNNDVVLLDGIIELTGIDQDSYNCQFYSKFTQLVDAIGASFVNELTVAEDVIVASEDDIEKSIVDHIESNYTIEDTTYQFPLVYYKTFRTPEDILPTLAYNDEDRHNFNTLFVESKRVTGSTFTRNWMYYNQFPPAFYLVSILEKIFESVGWTLGGTWQNDPNVRKIIIPYVGDSIPPEVEGTFPNYRLNWNVYLPNIKSIDFLKMVISNFNLYFKIDVVNKTMIFENFNTMFNGNQLNYYDITSNVDVSTISKEYEQDVEPQIVYSTDDNNKLINGRSRSVSPNFGELYLDYGIDIRPSVNSIFSLNSFFLNVNFTESTSDIWFNKTTGNKEIKLANGLANTFLIQIQLNTNINGVAYSGSNAFIPINIPIISKQTLTNNEGNPFDDGSNESRFFDETTFYSGKLQLLYYYGQFSYNAVDIKISFPDFNDRWTGQIKDWAYINIATGGTSTVPTGKRVRVPIASPYKLVSNTERDLLFEELKNYCYTFNGSTYVLKLPEFTSVKAAEIMSLLSVYYCVGDINDLHEPTDYSLVFCPNEDLLFDNLWSVFHKPKYSEINNTFTFKAKMRMDENDWREMQINRTIKYNNELYRLVSIKNYDPISRSADIELLKKV